MKPNKSWFLFLFIILFSCQNEGAVEPFEDVNRLSSHDSILVRGPLAIRNNYVYPTRTTRLDHADTPLGTYRLLGEAAYNEPVSKLEYTLFKFSYNYNTKVKNVKISQNSPFNSTRERNDLYTWKTIPDGKFKGKLIIINPKVEYDETNPQSCWIFTYEAIQRPQAFSVTGTTNFVLQFTFDSYNNRSEPTGTSVINCVSVE